ncbi:Ig-like domain-containing protein [Paraburkholderia ginsengisoli]|uniref:Uncharacterized protein n=1 Tax=Paraburkholderia ginsengisoli TaxID=311231 RepID=A0A7T4T9H1_9BURK|nr:hypothetical protein [Paraburkholderia ginsengisoli]QQC64488.1 hypothetical protein I6I06_03120 [Paraburkholderia ginsengisoli]
MDYFELGKTDAANMTHEEMFYAFRTADGQGTMSVTITVKDVQGNPVVRNMRGDEFITYLTAWPVL